MKRKENKMSNQSLVGMGKIAIIKRDNKSFVISNDTSAQELARELVRTYKVLHNDNWINSLQVIFASGEIANFENKEFHFE